MKEKILFSSIYRIINRQGNSERPEGIVWLEVHGISIPYNINFYAVILFVPFIFSVGYGVSAEAKLFGDTYGLNIIIVALLLISILITADYYHSMNYFQINLKFFKIAPISNSEVFKIKFLVEVFGYKFYVFLCAIIMLVFFNYSYVENIIYYLPPKSFILLIDIYLSYCLLSLIVKQTTKITINSKWADIIIRLIAALIFVVILIEAQAINDFQNFISLKAKDIMNNDFWFKQVFILGLISATYPTIKNLLDWKR